MPGRSMTSQQHWTLFAMSLVMIVLTMDFFGITVALPTIGKDLDASTSTLEWTINAYLIAIAAPLIAVGRVADIIGRKRTTLIGIGIFAVASVLCATAQTDLWLIGARVVQGFGGSILLATSLSIVSAAFPDEQRAGAIGVWSAVGSIGGAVGPFVGGVLTQELSWRWFFLINVPVALVAIVITARHVDESRDETASRHLDWAGLATVTLGLVLLVLGFQQSSELGWAASEVWGSLVVGIAMLGAFVVVEHRARDPLVDFTLFRSRVYAGASGVAFMAQWVFGVTMFLVPLYLQQVLAESPTKAGLVLLVFTVPFTVMSLRIGVLTRRFGAQPLMLLGVVILAVACVVFAFVSTTTGIALMIAGLVVEAIGEGLAYNLSTTVAMSAVADQKAGIASGVFSTFRFVGMTIGLAISGAVFRSFENRSIADDLGAAGKRIDESEVRGLLSGSRGAREHLAQLAPKAAGQVDAIVDQAFTTGLRAAMIVCLVAALIAIPFALLSRSRRA
jgi:EmrB/QacA subfamily drug resistance transporter